jgi:hypothetical protein
MEHKVYAKPDEEGIDFRLSEIVGTVKYDVFPGIHSALGSATALLLYRIMEKYEHPSIHEKKSEICIIEGKRYTQIQGFF